VLFNNNSVRFAPSDVLYYIHLVQLPGIHWNVFDSDGHCVRPTGEATPTPQRLQEGGSDYTRHWGGISSGANSVPPTNSEVRRNRVLTFSATRPNYLKCNKTIALSGVDITNHPLRLGPASVSCELCSIDRASPRSNLATCQTTWSLSLLVYFMTLLVCQSGKMMRQWIEKDL
jgi:hypothetical protein